MVYGHTHVEAIDVIGTTLCVNPGSPTYPRNLNTQLGTARPARDRRAAWPGPACSSYTRRSHPEAGLDPVEHLVAGVAS